MEQSPVDEEDDWFWASWFPGSLLDVHSQRFQCHTVISDKDLWFLVWMILRVSFLNQTCFHLYRKLHVITLSLFTLMKARKSISFKLLIQFFLNAANHISELKYFELLHALTNRKKLQFSPFIQMQSDFSLMLSTKTMDLDGCTTSSNISLLQFR